MDDMDSYQVQAEEFCVIENPTSEYFILGLNEEAGEVAGRLKKKMRGQNISNKELALELGDTLWYLAMAANHLGYDLSEIASMNLSKLMDRQSRGVIKGEGGSR